MLKRLIYTSASLEAATPEMMASIVEAADRNNRKNGVTGLLIAAGDCFFQVLEGTPDMVDETYRRITEDTRHGDPLILWDQPIEERLFPDWAMRWRELSPADPLTNQIQRTHTLARNLDHMIPEDDPVNILMSVFLDSLGH